MRNLPRSGAVALVGFLLAACGGGGHGQSAVLATVHGTAAAGAAITNALVTVKDANGVAVTTRTDAIDGTFDVVVGWLTPPFLVEVDDGAGHVLFSVGTEAGVVNVTPFTDLIVSTFYDVQGITLNASFFDSFSWTDPAPSPIEVQTIKSVVETMISLWLQSHGVDPAAFDPITTPFVANGLGADAVLEHSTVVGGAIVIDDGTTTQTSTLSADPSGTVTVDTTTTSGGSTTTSTDTTEIPTSSGEATDLDAVAATVQDFFAVVNARGAALTDADLLPFFDAGFLDDGKSRTVSAASLATQFRPSAPAEGHVVRVLGIDDVNHLVTVCLDLSTTAGGQTTTGRVTMAFKRNGSGDFLLFGNQRLVDPWIRMEANTYLDGTGANVYEGIVVDVSAPVGTVNNSVTIDGGPFASTPLGQAPGTRTDRYFPTPTTTLDYIQDFFPGYSQPPALVPPAGTVFHVHFTPTGGVPTTYDIPGNGVTNEHITITTPTGHLLADANLGGTRPFGWTLPQTYLVASIDISGKVYDAIGNELVVQTVEPFLPPTSTSGTFQFPASWDDAGGHHVTTHAEISVATNGPNGEYSHVIYEFKN
jgi:hypothetical protein